MTDFQAYKSSIARIFSGNDVMGVGFLVSECHVLTCAHVVAAALGVSSTTAAMPGDEVEFDMPLLADGRRVKGRVEFWAPVNPGQVGEDIAVLKVKLGDLPTGAQAARLVVADEPWEHKFGIVGFPEKYDDGIWASGVLREQLGKGWVQLEDVKEQGYAIEKGFSGAPVWDETLKAVVGMAVAADRQQTEARAAFMIPTSILSLAWNGLAYVGLEQILRPVEEKITLRLATAYGRSCPPDWRSYTPETLSEQIQELEDMPLDEKSNTSLVKFVAYLVADLESNVQSKDEKVLVEKLRKWAQHQSTGFEEIIRQIEQQQSTQPRLGNSYLMVIVDRIRGQDRYKLKVWVIPDDQHYDMQSGRGSECLISKLKWNTEQDYSYGEIKSLFKDLIDESCDRCEDFIIEFFLPAKLLNTYIDFWVLEDEQEIDEDEEYMRQPLGCQYLVTFRSSDRLTPNYINEYSESWKRKWGEVKQLSRKVANDVLWPADGQHHQLTYQKLKDRQDIKVGIKLAREPLSFGAKSNFGALQAVAAPVAIWLRQGIPNNDCAQQINDLLNCPLIDLPKILQEQRINSLYPFPEEHIGYHLAILWDDFDRLPPYTVNDLKWPEP